MFKLVTYTKNASSIKTQTWAFFFLHITFRFTAGESLISESSLINLRPSINTIAATFKRCSQRSKDKEKNIHHHDKKSASLTCVF